MEPETVPAPRTRATSPGVFLRSNTKWLLTAVVLIASAGAIAVSTHQPTATPSHTPAGAVTVGTVVGPGCTLLPQEAPPPGTTFEFGTNFAKHCVHYSEILSGGPVKDGISAIDAPKIVTVGAANAWLRPVEPVIFFQVGGDARAYPIQILIWHEVVNDTVGGVPVTVTFCPLCNTAIAFERTVNGRVLDFGTTGRLRFSNLVMYDRQTESWWRQALGLAIAGEYTGTQLVARPAAIIAWSEFKAAHHDGRVLSRDTGFDRPYGQNPYRGYDNINSSPYLYQGPPLPGTLKPLARILAITVGGSAVAYPFETLGTMRVVNDTVGGTSITVFWTPGTASPLDRPTTSDGRDVGSATAFASALNGQQLTFTFDGAHFVDAQTGSQWDGLGRAVSGKLAGQALTPVTSAVNAFWFAWISFQPATRVYHG
jgi:Protein of unknown function (DUF3179)